MVAINGSLQQTDRQPGTARPRDLIAPRTLDDLDISNDILERLAKWLKQLREKLVEIVKTLGAATYSITVGGPAPAVSVTIEFTRRRGRSLRASSRRTA